MLTLDSTPEAINPYDGSLTLFVEDSAVRYSILHTTHGIEAGGEYTEYEMPSTPELPAYPDNDSEAPLETDTVAPTETHYAYVKRENGVRRARAAHRLAVTAIGGSIVVGGALGLFNFDQNVLAQLAWTSDQGNTYQIASNKFHLSEDTDQKAFQRAIALAKQPPATDVMTFGGMGINDSGPGIALPLVPSLNEHIPNSKLYALEYGNKVNLPNIYKGIDHMLEESPADVLIFDGMSTGCKTALYAASYVRTHYPDKFVKAVICDSGPYDPYSTYELRQSNTPIAMSEWSATLELTGGPLLASTIDLFSSYTRAKYTNADSSINWDSFWQEVERIHRDTWNSKAASNMLRMGQLALIVEDSAPDNIAALAADPESKQPPTSFIYIAPTHDNVVDGNYAADKYSDLAAANGLPFYKYAVDADHAGEHDSPDNYNHIIDEALQAVDAGNAQFYATQGYLTGSQVWTPGRPGGL